MGKDPAFLFYYQDFSWGTRRFSMSQKGLYIELICEQADSKTGCISKENMSLILKNCDFETSLVLEKFLIEDEGYYNDTLREHLEKRRKYVKSRSNNRKKGSSDSTHIYLIKDTGKDLVKIGNSVDPHRRLIELNNQLDKKLVLIGYSEKVKQENESYLHKKFDKFREFGEWFSVKEQKIINHMIQHMNLSFKYHMTQHMENENENENENINKDTTKKEQKDQYKDVFDFYISKNLIKHKTLTQDMKKAINKASKELNLTIESLKTIILRHEEKVIETANTEYPTKKRSLAELFGQKKYGGTSLICVDYLDENWEEYKRNKKIVKNEVNNVNKVRRILPPDW